MKTLFISLLMTSLTASADMDAASQEALQQTQDLMTNSAERQKVIDQSPNLKGMDDKVSGFAGSGENKDHLYKLSADIMKKLTEQNNGDPEAMKKVLEEAQKNPEKFFNTYFDGQQRKAVRDIADDIQKTKGETPKDPPK